MRPLVLAFNYDHFQLMELLLIRGADPNGVEPQRHSTLLHVVAGRGSTEVAGLLLRHGGDVNAKVRDSCHSNQQTAVLGYVLLRWMRCATLRCEVSERC